MYNVERIVDHRTRGLKYEYYVKWEGWGSIHNTWEPIENFFCPLILEEYNEQHGLLIGDFIVNDLLPNEEMQDPEKKTPEKIVNIHQLTDNEEDLYAIVKWKDTNCMEYVPIQWARINCPDLVIAFYETRLYFREMDGTEIKVNVER